MALLEVRDLRTHFDTRQGVVKAVDGVSFDLHAGETLGLVGESGCGKSVTALSVMRLLPEPPAKAVGGEVIFAGRDLLKMPARALRAIRGKEIAMIFQDPMTSLNPVLTVGDQIAEAITSHGEVGRGQARARAVELLEAVNIPSASSRLDDYPHQFSGGMRQRVMIAMAVSLGPKVIIADEPTTALDVTIQAQVLDLLKRLSSESGTGTILITHDLGVVAGLAHRVHVMYAGRIVEKASTKTLFTAPKMPYTWGLLRSVPRLDQPRASKLVPIEGLPPHLGGDATGCRFEPRCPYRRPICGEREPALLPVSSVDQEARCWGTQDVPEGGWLRQTDWRHDVGDSQVLSEIRRSVAELPDQPSVSEAVQ